MDRGARNGLVLLPGEGRATLDGRMVTKAGTDDTHGAYSLQEVVVPPGRSIPAHLHHNEEEAWYVMEGELSFRLGERTLRAPAGMFVLGPRGLAHAYANSGTQTAKVLMIFSPAGFEQYFEERQVLAQGSSVTAAGVDYAGLDDEVHARLAARYGLEFIR